MASQLHRRITVLAISPWGNDWDFASLVGNPENALFYEKLAKSDIELHLILPYEKRFNRRLPVRDGFFLHPLSTLKFPPIRKLGYLLSFAQYLGFNALAFYHGIKLAKKIQIDLIYGIGSVSIPAASLLARVLKKPVIGKLLGVWGLYPILKHNLRYLLDNFDSLIGYRFRLDRLIVVNDGTQGDRAAEELKPPVKGFLFWQNPVDKTWIHQPHDEHFRDRYARPNQILLFAAAQLYVLKGLSFLIRAMALVVAACPDVTLLIAGTGVERNSLEALVKKLNLESKVLFLGGVRFLEMRGFYHAADIFVTTHICTNATLTTGESLVSGLPVVAFDVRDTRTVVRDGETGLLVRPFDIEDLAKKIMVLVKDGSLRKNLGKQAREFALRNLPSWNDRLELEVQLIRELCE